MNRLRLSYNFIYINQPTYVKSIYIEPLMTEVTRFLGKEHTWQRMSLLTAVSLIYQAIPVVPTVLDYSQANACIRKPSVKIFILALMSRSWCVWQIGQVHSRILSDFLPSLCPHSEQV